MQTKRCGKCGREKAVDAYTKCSRAKDGLQYACRDCQNAIRKANYYANLEREKATSHAWNMANTEARSAKSKEKYAANRERELKKCAERYRAHKERTVAKKAVKDALRSGELVRPEGCPECGSDRYLSAHHWSYHEQHYLAVIWLCKSCHQLLHGRMRQTEEEVQHAAQG